MHVSLILTPNLATTDEVLPKCYSRVAREGEEENLEACLERRRHFTPFVCSVDAGLLGREAKTFAKRLAAKLASKWEKTYSQACGCINARLSIAIVRATHL
jgi:hypothetical protein